MLTPETIRALMANPMADLDSLHDPEPSPQSAQADLEAMLEAMAERKSLARFEPKKPKGKTNAANIAALTPAELERVRPKKPKKAKATKKAVA